MTGVSGFNVLAAYGSFCTPSRDAMVAEEMGRIEGAFDRLSDEHREVILQARLEGRSHREIALEMGKSETAVRKLLSRARENWRHATLLCVTHDIEQTRTFDRVLVLDPVLRADPSTSATLPLRSFLFDSDIFVPFQ